MLVDETEGLHSFKCCFGRGHKRRLDVVSSLRTSFYDRHIIFFTEATLDIINADNTLLSIAILPKVALICTDNYSRPSSRKVLNIVDPFF